MKLRINQSSAKAMKVKSPVAPGLEDDSEATDTLGRRKGRRGPKSGLGPAGRFCLFIPDSLREDFERLIADFRKNKIKVKMSLATVLRQGALLCLSKKRQELNKALKGQLHAKRRK